METTNAALVLLGLFLTLMVQIFLSQGTPFETQILLIGFSGLICAVAGVLVYRKNKSKQYKPPKFATEKSHKRIQFFNGIMFCLQIFEGLLFILFPVFSWQVYFVDGVPVVTYSNAFLIGGFILGLWMLIDILRRLRTYRKEKDIDVLLNYYV